MTDPGRHPVSAIWGTQARNGGLVVMLRAFFDETDSQKSMLPERLIGIGGVIFDDSGYEKFQQDWGAVTSDVGLKKPFRMTQCYPGYGQFDHQRWDTHSRKRLWNKLGGLIAETTLAQFICFLWKHDYDEFVAVSPTVPDVIGSPYSLCLLYCAELMGDFAKGRDIFLTFETGDANEREAAEFFRKANASTHVRENVLRVGGYAFVSKALEPALAAADYMAWSFQRALADPHGDKGWHEAFEIVRSDTRRPTFVCRLTAERMGIQGMFNTFYGLQKEKA